MSLAAHIASLEDRHHKLEVHLQDELHRPMPDFAVIQSIKKQKLAVKEELAGCSKPSKRHDAA